MNALEESLKSDPSFFDTRAPGRFVSRRDHPMHAAILALALLGQAPNVAPPDRYTVSVHTHVTHGDRATVTTPATSDSDLGFLPALEVIRKAFTDTHDVGGSDIKGDAHADLVGTGPHGIRFFSYGKGNSRHEAILDAIRLAKEHLKK